jgi:F-type H+-transporting ATPase subunit gamma
LLSTDIPLEHPLLETREEKETALLVITSDTGLCGSYNHSLVGETKNVLAASLKAPVLIGIGKNGINALSRAGYSWNRAFTDTKTSQVESVITETAALIEALFRERKVDAVYAVYTHFTGRSVFRATTEKILPFRLEAKDNEPVETANLYIMEPNREALFSRLVPLVFAAKMRMIFMESMIAEHMARMNAMHQATENAKELIDTLVLLRNKIRQAAITKELIEIVSGSKALKQ